MVNIRRKFLKVSVFSFVTILLIGFTVLSFRVYQLYTEPMIALSSASVRFQISPSTSAGSFARMLEERQMIYSQHLFRALIRFRGAAHHLKAGIYEIKPGESADVFLSRVIAGDVIIHLFQIIEGTTQSTVAKHLATTEGLRYDASDWLAIAGIYPSAEGLLLADTYHYNAGSSSKDVLTQAHNYLMQYLTTSWQQRDPNLPYKSSYELLIAASILEKEAAIPKEKRVISGIIVNRLRVNMPLQMDPTVIYAMGDSFKRRLTRNDLQMDSAFNTYRHRGLPPTPIAMVGRDAIDAAAHPEPSNYLYYVATGDGHHTFSSNYDQQREAVARYRGKNEAK